MVDFVYDQEMWRIPMAAEAAEILLAASTFASERLEISGRGLTQRRLPPGVERWFHGGFRVV